jgi:acetylornithine deacetylase/succinyl-diaminopimelate desuccinylase-like protein
LSKYLKNRRKVKLKKFTTLIIISLVMCVFLVGTNLILSAAVDIKQFVDQDATAQKILQIINEHTLSTAEFLVKIGSIKSPSGQELERAEAVAQQMRDIGLQNVEVDKNPNVIGIIPGQTDSTLVFVSTLDDLATVAEHQQNAGKPPYIEGDKVIGPGTNTSLTTASMLAAAEALIISGAKPYYTLVFASVAQEETGLKGMFSLYEKYKDSAFAFVDILGEGSSISYGSMGVFWWKVYAEGPEGHTRSTGPNVNQAIGRAVDQILSLDYPVRFADDQTFINIAILQSGAVFNHKPASGWFSLDIRSLKGDITDAIEMDVRKILEKVGNETNIKMRMETEMAIPGGQIPGAIDSPLVQNSVAIARYLGVEPTLSNASSSNMNVAVGAGTLAIGLGGERGGDRATATEWASIPVMINTARHVALLGIIMGR